MAYILNTKRGQVLMCAYIFFICTLLFEGCFHIPIQGTRSINLTIRDIAYDFNKEKGFTIYILEHEQYNPYLVLTDDYNGNCLLLRKYLLNDMLPYNEQNDAPSYYRESKIDHFLNNEFFNSFSEKTQSIITLSEIDITDIDSIGIVGTDIIRIQRKVFLLSYTETTQEESLVNAIEGNPLTIFIENSDLINAATSDNIAGSWWLRTPNTAYYNAVYAISPDGYVGVCRVGGSEIEEGNGVRPAFCVPCSSAIRLDNINGEEIYVLQ